MRGRLLAATLGAAVTVGAPAAAQNSIYGVRGIGFPGRAASVRSIALGGGSAIFDPASPLNPGTAVLVRAVTVGAVGGTTFREYAVRDVSQTGLKETRFPSGYVGGAVGRWPVSFNVGFSTFVERSFDFETTGTVVTNGRPVEVTDRISSDGGVVDIRAAVGYLASPRLGLGAAYHLLVGSSRVVASRNFADDGFRRFEQTDDISYSGAGVSVGVAWWAHPRLHFAFVARGNSDLTNRLGDGSSEDLAMPRSLAAGVSLGISRGLRLASTGRWRTWSRLAPDAGPTEAFDTFEVGTGLEVGSSPRFPLRLGARYAQLPFGPSADQPHEWNFSLGTGTPFAGNRAVIDVAVLRLQRDGTGVSERGWYVTMGITVTPAR